MMGWSFHTPAVDELLNAAVKPDSAVRIADLESWAGHTFAIGGKKFQAAIGGWRHGQGLARAEFHASFDAHAIAALSVIESQAAQDGPAFGDPEVKRTIMA